MRILSIGNKFFFRRLAGSGAIMSLNILGYEFEYVCDILPDTDSNGTIVELYPQEKYRKKGSSKLHKYGSGPFCKFRISNDWTGKQGVYLIVVNQRIEYVGECDDLASRYNTGYGNISPRNCFVGGQSTNCKVNNNILKELKNGKCVKLYFHESTNRFVVEDVLIEKLTPLWNSKSGNKQKHSSSAKYTKEFVSNPIKSKQIRVSINYELLSEYLLALKCAEHKLTYDLLEQIIESELPESAYKHRAWWANGGHSHAEYWLNAGWKVEGISLGQYVVFKRLSE